MCTDSSIINIKYDDEYKVQTDFSIFYKNMVYDYTEYRVLNDRIKIYVTPLITMYGIFGKYTING